MVLGSSLHSVQRCPHVTGAQGFPHKGPACLTHELTLPFSLALHLLLHSALPVGNVYWECFLPHGDKT